uniref:Glycosyltransferase n=1 Tax=Leersia perrieri TaxID=77586 RepID=A0A0D9WWM2_9ORYZ
MGANGGAGAGDDDASATAVSPALHIVMFPWLAFGHLIPFLELAKLLAARGHAVITFLSTPRNLSRLGAAAAIPPELSAFVRLVSFPLPEVDGLPEGAESTADVPPEKVELLKKAFDGLAAPFAAFLAAAAAGDEESNHNPFSRKPDWVVVDFANVWAPPIARGEHGVPCAWFSIYSAAALAFFGPRSAYEAHPRGEPEDFMSPPPWIPFPSALAFRRHEAEWIAAAYRPNASGVSDVGRIWQVQDGCDVILYRSCPDVEGPDICGLLDDLYHKPVVPTGLLLPPPSAAAADSDSDGLIRWLDDQPERSVIYVALGTEAPVTSSDVHELALGLELSGARFLWALRGDGERWLPEGYMTRLAGRGHVASGWVPQVRVLCHVAVGAFLTHCGWGSTVESLRFGGLPLVMLPFITDQGLIARAMADRGLGVEVERKDDGSFGMDAVAAAVRRVMSAEEDGKVFARNAREMKEKLGDGARQERYVDELAELLRRHCRSWS